MCGIAGFVDRSRSLSAEELTALAGSMTATLKHRGPDDEGIRVDPAHGVALGHRRLAILDLSALGHQPMESACGRYTIVFNGEIYNFRALRQQLTARGQRFRGHSDTEVLLAAVATWGLQEALLRSNGMFAFALWDRDTATLHLARDRIGEKPLYYALAGDVFLFGSELKSIVAHPAFRPHLDRDALALFLRLSFVPAPSSIYRDVRKLPPGSVLSLRPGHGPLPAPTPWWSARDAVRAALADPVEMAEADAVDELDRLLRDAVRLRMESDVPLGAFLSGGIDSSLVVAAMQAQSERPVRTFTVSFAEASHDEAASAAAVAAHLGTEHTEVRLAPHDAMDVVPRLPELYDEPFSDPSQLPTATIAAAAREHVTVCLSGDGGDEVFAGYNRYTHGPALWARLRRLPAPLSAGLSRGLLAPSHRTWDRAARAGQRLTGARDAPRNVADKLQKLARLLRAEDEAALHRALVSHWEEPARIVPGASARESWPLLSDGSSAPGRGEFASVEEWLMFLDTVTELPDCMLVKVDRASMGVGLEVRVPLLDHRLLEFSWRLPLEMKLRDGRGKRVLRAVLDRYVPGALVDRPKMGFDPPIAAWLRGPLRDWAESLLAAPRLADGGVFDPAPVRARWREHLDGTRNWDYPLWAVLVFQAWREGRPLSV